MEFTYTINSTVDTTQFKYTIDSIEDKIDGIRFEYMNSLHKIKFNIAYPLDDNDELRFVQFFYNVLNNSKSIYSTPNVMIIYDNTTIIFKIITKDCGTVLIELPIKNCYTTFEKLYHKNYEYMTVSS